MSILATIASAISAPIVGGLKIRQARIEGKVRIAEKMADGETAWELAQLQGSSHSWKDEYWTIILSLPLILVFVPPLVPHVKAGFAALETLPEWYQYVLGIAITSSFGVKMTATVRKMFGKGL